MEVIVYQVANGWVVEKRNLDGNRFASRVEMFVFNSFQALCDHLKKLSKNPKQKAFL
jgi:hypothetical protein